MNEELKKELERINAIPEKWELGNGYVLIHHHYFDEDKRIQITNGDDGKLMTEAQAIERLKEIK